MARKWRDKAAPDDPGAWYAIGNMWPTGRGTLETADSSTGASASSSIVMNNASYAFFFDRNSEFVAIDSAGTGTIQWWNGTTFSNVTPAGFSGAGWSVARGSLCMARFGDVVLACTSTLTTPEKIQVSTNLSSPSFADITDAPTGKNILVVQASAVAAFSTANANYHICDPGDYTNWTTANALNGTLYDVPGKVSAALAYGKEIYAFKPTGIIRMSFVGGTRKWNIETAWKGIGIPRDLTGSLLWPTNDWAVATRKGIVFYGGAGKVYLFDGTAAPVCINPETTIPVETTLPVFTYDPQRDIVCLASSFGSSAAGQSYIGGALVQSRNYYYSLQDNSWGDGYGSADETNGTSASVSGVLRGNDQFQVTGSPKPVFYYALSSVSGFVKRCTPQAPTGSSVAYAQSSMVGSVDKLVEVSRVTPLLRRRDDAGGGSVSLELKTFDERHNEDASATSTRTITESSFKNRFDTLGGAAAANFIRAKVTYTGLNPEIDDLSIQTSEAGEE